MALWSSLFSVRKEDFKDYGLAVAKHWVWLFFAVAAAFFFAGQVIAQSMNGEFSLPAWVWILIVFVLLTVAQFLTFTDVKRERDQLRIYNISQSTLTQISEYREQLVRMQNEKISDEEMLGSWRQRYEDMRVGIVDNISTHISQAEANSFQTLGLFGEVEIQGQPPFNDSHKHWRSRIVRDYFWLDSLVRDYGRQTGRPGMNAEAPTTIFAMSSTAVSKPDEH